MPIKELYEYYPQMKLYDDLSSQVVPYLMFMSQNNYYSEVVNTDSNGFRFSGADGKLRIDNLDRTNSVNVFTGGSTAFGIGSSSDKSTISAYLSHATNSRWVNFSGRANVSTQEFISFAYYRDQLPSVDNFVIFSGVNDLYLYFASKYFNRQMGSFFMATDFITKLNRDLRYGVAISRLIINKMLEAMYGRYDFNIISNRDAMNLLFRKTSIADFELNLIKYSPISKHSKNPHEVLDVLRRNISNWKIMAEHYNAKITYVLQPFANWLPNRILTDNEKNIFDILDRKGGENWNTLSESINSLHGWYSKELSTICEDQNINYYDSNSYLNKDFNDDIFIDRIHLTDYGNKKISDFILEKI